MKTAKRDWCGLPSHLLSLVFSHLSIFDCARCRLVCTYWRSAVDAPNPRAPLLLLPDADPNFRNLFCLSDRKLHRLRLPHIAGSLKFPGSTPNGFLATIDSSANLHLINPLTGTRIPLPPITTFSEVERAERAPDQDIIFEELKPHGNPPRRCQVKCAYYRKLALFPASPSSSTVAFVIHGGSLAFARPGDESWTEISSNSNPEDCYGFHDVVCHKGQFYAVRSRGSVVAFDISVWPPRETFFPGPARGRHEMSFHSIYYLVETADGTNLLLVIRFLAWVEDQVTVNFQVFKLERSEWVEVQSFGHGSSTALFLGLGTNISLSVCTKDSPELKENCIYTFRIDGHRKLRATGTYSLEDGRIEPLLPGDDPRYDQFDDQFEMDNVPIWFMPNFS